MKTIKIQVEVDNCIPNTQFDSYSRQNQKFAMKNIKIQMEVHNCIPKTQFDGYSRQNMCCE